MNHRRVGRGLIAILCGALLVVAVGPSAVAAAYNTRAGGQIVAGQYVMLQKSGFDVHAGNDMCATDSGPPSLVPDSSTGSFCYEASGFAGEGKYDTEVSFSYAIFVQMAGETRYDNELINAQTKKCIDDPGQSREDGTPLQMYACNRSGAQYLDLTADGALKLLGLCITSGDGPIRLRTCNRGPDQRWKIDAMGRLRGGPRLACLDIQDRSSSDGARLVLAECDDSASQRWFGWSGYYANGRVKVPYSGTTELSCSLQKVRNDKPARRFSCPTSTARDIKSSYDPGPIWKVTGAPPPEPDAARVVFLGDSVTAGFGYCGAEGGARSDDITCGVNQPFANAFTGTNSLQACKPVDVPFTVNDRCSNNNLSGYPWDAGPWADIANAPTIAYPFVIAKRQRPADQATVEDWALTGSEPKDWDKGGAFDDQLARISDSWVVMTLGANPLLSDYIQLSLGPIVITKGVCASDTTFITAVGRVAVRYATPLDADKHTEGTKSVWGVLHCFMDEWTKIKQTEHLLGIYKALLSRNNHVLVVGYPTVCPWTFGDWQPTPNPFDGPAKGNACPGQSAQVFGGQGRVSQWDQAKALGDLANDRMARLAAQAGTESGKADNIRFAPPDGAWRQHQAWDGESWVFKNDTWVHPSVQGHEQLAATVTKAMCSAWQRWCGNPPHWKPDEAR